MSMSTVVQKPKRTDGNIVVRILYGSEDCAVAGRGSPGCGEVDVSAFAIQTRVGDDPTPGTRPARTLDDDELRRRSASTNTVDGRLVLGKLLSIFAFTEIYSTRRTRLNTVWAAMPLGSFMTSRGLSAFVLGRIDPEFVPKMTWLFDFYTRANDG